MTGPIRILGTFNYEDGKFVSVDKNRKNFNRHRAIEIPYREIANYYPINTISRAVAGGGLNFVTVKAGETYPVVGGRRIVIEAKPESILFVFVSDKKKLPRLFMQTPSGFHSDWLAYVQNLAASRLAATVVLAEWEIQFLAGVCAGIGWKGLAFVVGMDVFEEAVTGEKRKATRELVKVLRILGKTKIRLKKVAPTLESVISELLWFSLLKGQYNHMIHVMAHDPKIASRAAGTITVQLSKQAIDKRLTVTSVLWSICMQFAIKATTSIPAAAKATVDQFKDSGDIEKFKANLDRTLHSVGIVMSDKEKKMIVEEIKSQPEIIAEIFKDMSDEMKSLTQH